jgi:prepilin-type N-terminal cleavage/methylation domain-containing protein
MSRSRPAGFTLIEVVAAMTVMSLVVVVLYYSFSTALITWSKQDADNEEAERTVAMARLLTEDLNAGRPYTVNWKEGKDFFFAASERAVFYVTTSGFGATERTRGGLYFCCLYLSRQEDGADALYLCKVNYPSPEIVQELHNFRQLSESRRADFRPPGELREKSVLLLGGLGEPAFSFSERETKAGDALATTGTDEDGESLPETDWQTAKLPLAIQFQAKLKRQEFRVVAKPRQYVEEIK